MNEEQRQILLKVAAGSVTAAVNNQTPSAPVSDDPELNALCGCFVTLKNHGRLRGCIGQFEADEPLIQLISRMAVAAATKDSRFFANPITPKELNSLDLEISVLSPLQKTDAPASLRLGIDGIYIKNGFNSGCFLPQVATETGWDVEQFLANCCEHKALLPPDAWKDPETEVYLFTVDAFGSLLTEI